MPLPLLLCAQHRFVMGCAHYNAVFVCERGIQRVILVEGVVPHRGPEVVGLQSQQQFKNLGIELMIVVAVFFFHPSGEGWRFIVQENSAVLNCRRSLHIGARLYKEFIVMLDGNVGPPIPRRNPNLVGKVIDAVNCSAFIAPRDNQRAGHARQWFRHDANEKRFPFAGNGRHIDFAIANQLIDDFAFSNSANDDHV